jgi:hypothetical protein
MTVRQGGGGWGVTTKSLETMTTVGAAGVARALLTVKSDGGYERWSPTRKNEVVETVTCG